MVRCRLLIHPEIQVRNVHRQGLEAFRRAWILVFCVVILAAGGCRSHSTWRRSPLGSVPGTPKRLLEEALDKGRWHEAARLLPAALADLEKEYAAMLKEVEYGPPPTNPAEYTMFHTMGVISLKGERDWIRILKDPEVLLEAKRILAEEIHAAAYKGMYP